MCFLKRTIPALALLLAGATFIFLSSNERFYVIEGLLEDPTFVDGQRYWKSKGQSDVNFSSAEIHIENVASSSHEVTQTFEIDTPAYFRFSIEAAAERIEPDEKNWAGGSATIVSYDGTGKRLGYKSLFVLRGSSAFRNYSKDIFLDESVASIGVSIRLLRASGKFSARNPSLALLSESSIYGNITTLICIFWSLIVLSLLAVLLRSLQTLQLLLLVGLAFFAIIGVLLPSQAITVATTFLSELVPQIGMDYSRRALTLLTMSPEVFSPSAVIGKLGHFFVFMLVGFWVGWLHRVIGVVYGLVCISIFAVCTEVLQMLVIDRTPSIYDFAIDMLGCMTGLFIGLLCVVGITFFRRFRGVC